MFQTVHIFISVASSTLERIREKVWKENTAKHSYFEAESQIVQLHT